jgi:DNA-binding NarL/FixJ family response regulator
MPGYPDLDRATLDRLRRVARGLHEDDGRAVPLAQLVALARDVRLDAGVTIDLPASRAAGGPFVVLRLAPEQSSAGCLATLSPREREVAGLVAEGLSNKQIARRLSITLATVKDHVHRILRKSGLPNRTAVAMALQGRPAP